MTHFSSPVAGARSAPGAGSGIGTRLAGVDAARGIALLGMIAVHIVPLALTTEAGETESTWAAELFAGRSSALFVLLSGVGLGLLSGGQSRLGGAGLAQVRRSVAVRALLVFVLGLGLGLLETHVAVILVHYGLLFIFAIPFLGAGARTLGFWAAGWLLLSPLALYLLRPWLVGSMELFRLGASPLPQDLATPSVFLADVFVTGYYPLVIWFGFILAGLCVGRLALGRRPVALALAVGGTGLAVSTKLLSGWLLASEGALKSLALATGAPSRELSVGLVTGQGLEGAMDTPWFLGVSAPHSGAPFDALHVTGCALAVLGAAQLLCMALTALLSKAGEVLLWPLTGAGAATLTLYVGHLVALDLLSEVSADAADITVFIGYCVACLVFGLVVKITGRRGPLEALVHSTSRTLARST